MTISRGGLPRRAGQLARTRSWLPPMPPEVTTTAWAAEVEVADGLAVGGHAARLAWRGRAPRRARRRRRRPRSPARRPGGGTAPTPDRPGRHRAPVGRTAPRTPGPVPQVMWKRGTELPCPRGAPVAALGPAHDREEPHARARAARPASRRRRTRRRRAAQRRAHRSSSCRSKPAVPSQSCQARSRLSLTPIRRCSGESTRNSPPKDQNAWPPRLAADSWSTSRTRRPAATSSAVATRPDRPGPDDDDIGVHHGTPRVETVRRPQPTRGQPTARVRTPPPPTMGAPCRSSPPHRSAPVPAPGRGCGSAGRPASSP